MMEAPQKSADSTDIIAAANWLATRGADKNEPVVPHLRSLFGLSAVAAIAAIREANLIRARSL